MTIVYLVVGLVVGLLVGYLIGLSMLKKNKAVWEEELTGARQQLGTLRKEASAAVQEANARAQAAQAKIGGVGSEIARYKEAAVQAQSSLEQLQTQFATAREAADAHKNARQQAENRYRKAEESLSQAQLQIQQMGQEIEKAAAAQAGFKESSQRQARELQRLRAETTSARGSSSGLDQSVELFAGADGSLEGVLGILLENEGQSAAVCADSNGIIVAAAGDAQLREGMAATTTMIDTAIKQLEGMVPFSKLRAYMLMDEGSNVIAGRFFNCAGENVGLATYGPRVPGDRTLDGAMANLSSILE